ncbi:putative SP-containing protein [Vairimorpha necatrix]|uniref:SP-containing protein n=1 Tax=Vairimorpha necatrix TaxID=6039 RepID=A0AAX4J9U0_9MICR
MILLYNFINFARCNRSDYIEEYILENKPYDYVSIIPQNDAEYFRPYDELQKNLEKNQVDCKYMKSDFSLEKNTLESSRQILYDPIIIIKFYLTKCQNKINEFKILMGKEIVLKKRSQIRIEKRIEKEARIKNYYKKLEDLKFDDLCLNAKFQLKIIKKSLKDYNTPIEIDNILIGVMKLIKHFLKIYEMKKDLTGCEYLCTQSVEIHRFNIKIYSAFDYIPMIDTFEKMKTGLGLYRYENEIIKKKTELKVKELQEILYNIIFKITEGRKVYNKIIQIYKK